MENNEELDDELAAMEQEMLDEELPDANKNAGIFIIIVFFFYFEDLFLFYLLIILVPQQKVEVQESAKNKDLDDLEDFLN